MLWLLFFAFLSLSTAYDLVLVNSLDYGDIINGVDFAIFSNTTTRFIPHNPDFELMKIKIGTNRTIYYIEGNPISPALANYTLQNNNVTPFKSNNSIETNHLIFQELQPNKVVVVNYYYPDYAVSLLPFAIHNKYFILFTDGNVSKLSSLLDNFDGELLMFGPISGEVQTYLESKGAQTIGSLGGDRYEDNIALFNYYYNPQKFGRMALIASGTELEEGMVSNASMPIILTGDLVPSTIYEFIKSLAKNGTLKGLYIFERKLVTSVYNMKKNLEQELSQELNKDFKFGLLLKFGETVPGENPRPLGIFYLPVPVSELRLNDIVYDSERSALIFGLINPTSNIEYATIEGRIFVDGEQVDSFLTPLARFDSGESRAIVVPLNISKINSRNITVEYIIRYGLYRKSLDKAITGRKNVVIVNYVDPAQINVSAIHYDFNNKQLVFLIENIGDKTAYVFPKISYYEEGRKRIIKGQLLTLEPGESVQQTFFLDYKNSTIYMEFSYGSKPGLLLKTLSIEYHIREELPWWLLLLLLLLLVIVLLLVIFLFIKKKRKESEEVEGDEE